VTKNVLDQKSSNLCVPISIATLLRFAIKNDLGFEDKNDFYSSEKILSTLILIVYPRSMAGLNLNPNQKETEFQLNEIELLLERLGRNTYLMETGWQIIRKIAYKEKNQPKKSTCIFEQGKINSFFIIQNTILNFVHNFSKNDFSSSSRKLCILPSTYSHWRLPSSKWRITFPPNDARQN